MVYAHLLLTGTDLHVTLRFGSRFNDKEDAESMKPYIFETVCEESGHLGLLRAKLDAWSEEFGFQIQEIDEVARDMPTVEEHIALLSKAVREQAEARERAEQAGDELKLELELEHGTAHNFYHALQAKDMEAMHLDHVIHIAEQQFRCGHMREARAHHAEWIANNLH